MLMVANLTSSDVVISASNAKRAITVPAKVGSLTYGSPVDVTSELNGLTAGQYTNLETQRAGGGGQDSLRSDNIRDVGRVLHSRVCERIA